MAALTSLQNGTSSNQNLTTGVTIQGYAATAGQRLQPRVYVAQLNAAAATLTIGIRNTTDSSWVWRGTWIKGTATDTIAEPDFPAFIANAKTYAVYIQSTNASDTTTPDVTVDWFDVQKVDLDAVKGTSANATGLGAMGGNYDSLGVVDANMTKINGNSSGASGMQSLGLAINTEAFPGLSAGGIAALGTYYSTNTGVPVYANNDKTGYAIASNGLSSVTAWTVDITGDLSGSVGSIDGVTFPANFGAFVIHADGHAEANIVRVTGNVNSAVGLADLGATYDVEGHVNSHVILMSTDVISAASVSAAAVTKIQTGLSTLSAADIRTAIGLGSANLDVQLAAIVTDTNELQLDWMNGGRLDLILDAAAASAATASTNTSTIITNLAVVDGIVDDIKAVTVKMDTMLVLDGVVWQFTANALELGPTGEPATGNGDIAVDHNYGGTDELQILEADTDDPMDDALITAFAGGVVNGQTRTGSDGRWIAPLMLDAGSYTLVISKQGQQTQSVALVVNEP